MADPVAAGACAPDRGAFEARGFALVDELLDGAAVSALRTRLEFVLRGDYDLAAPPHRAPKAGGGKLASRSAKTVHVVDVARADAAFAALVRSPRLARIAADLGGWPHGARVANDQVWAKPPGCRGLVYHRDAPYFDEILPRSGGDRCSVVTLWIALDDMRDDAIGPLRYVPASHRWGDDRRGTARVFFARSAAEETALVRDAAARAGLSDFSTVPAHVPAGGAAMHDGRTWHGSGANSTDGPRRGLGIHFVPAVAAFDATVRPSRRGALWQPAAPSLAIPGAANAATWTRADGASAYARRCAAADAALADAESRKCEAALLLRAPVFAALDAASEARLAEASRATCAACFARGTRWHRPHS